METIKIVLVDDNLLERTGLTYLLHENDEHEIIAEAENGEQFLDLLNSCNPDIVFMDIKMPILDGFNTTKQALVKNPDLKVIAITGDETERAVEEMIFAGAKGFLTKPVGPNELKKAIATVINGGIYFSQELIKYYKLDIVYEIQTIKEILSH